MHKAHEPAADPAVDIFAPPLSERPLHKRALPDVPAPPLLVFQLLRTELLLDGNGAQNLATFCTMWADDEVRRPMDLCLDKNIVDKDEYPRTTAIESRCVNILAEPEARARRLRRRRRRPGRHLLDAHRHELGQLEPG